MRNALFAAAAAVALTLGAPASAAVLVGAAEFRLDGLPDGIAIEGDILQAGVTLRATTADFLGGSGAFDFSDSLFQDRPFPALVLSENSDFTFDTGFGVFSGRIEEVVPTTGATGFLAVTLSGDFVFDPVRFPTAENGVAELVFSLTQAGGAGNAVGVTFNLATPPDGTDPRDVPAPMSLALFGVGLAGIGLAARRRRRAGAAA